MLGLIHRTALGKGPKHFSQFFMREQHHDKTLRDPRKTCKAPLIKRSALGLVAIYNMLPKSAIAENSVSAFQKSLQQIVIKFAVAGCPNWSSALSPRYPLDSHLLTNFFSVALNVLSARLLS